VSFTPRTMHRTAVLRTIAAILVLGSPRPAGAQAAATSATPHVLFVCEHGTVRSLIAKLEFEAYAKRVGLAMSAVSRGTVADSVVPGWMLRALENDHVALGIWRPQQLLTSDLASAAMVVSFDVPTVATSAATAPRAQWDGLPSVSQNYALGRDAIYSRVHRLVDSLRSAAPRH
jgi:arsenate reductase (thioredoxin)